MNSRWIVPALLSLVPVFAPGFSAAQVCAPAQECGDVNGIEGISVGDALGVLRRSIGLSVDLECSCTGGEDPTGILTETGQTMCWDPIDVTAPINPIDCPDTGQDGDYQQGLPADFVDNGNGTVTDQRTTLQWEVLTDDGSIHDWDDFSYQWAGAFGKIEDLNEMNFAGHSDWRVPNIRELLTLVNFAGFNPAAYTMFSNECKAGCVQGDCSCTKSSIYWSSTTYQQSSTLAWGVSMQTGLTVQSSKTVYNYVRAVRGGL